MKPNIHPNWQNDIIVTCGCGSTFKTGSSFKSLTVDICSKCHPFYTGEMKFVDVQGRVEKFQAKQKMASAMQSKAKKKADKKADKQRQQPQSLRDMLQTIKQQNTAPKKTSKQ